MSQSRKRHDIWKGSLIETFDVTSPLEPKKPARPFAGTVDVRHEHRAAPILEQRAAQLQKWRDAYALKNGAEALAALESTLESFGVGQLVQHREFGYGVVTKVASMNTKNSRINVKFSGYKNSKKILYPGAFYTGALSFVPESREIRDEYNLHIFEPKAKPSAKEKSSGRSHPSLSEAFASNASHFSNGSLVRHERYGEGTVVAAKTDVLKIKFHDGRTRTFRKSVFAAWSFIAMETEAQNRRKTDKPADDRDRKENESEKTLTKKAAPSKGPKLRIQDGRLVCPICGHAEELGGSANRCLKCKSKGEQL